MFINPKSPDELADFLRSKPLILYGMGDTGKKIATWCKNHGVDYLISDIRAEELIENGVVNVILPQNIVKKYSEGNVVISSIVYIKEITNDLLQFGVKEEHIFPPFLFMREEVTLKELEVNGCVDWGRMNQRCRMILDWGWIPSGIRSVVDYSAGEGCLIKNFLPEKAVYYPVDYLDRGENTLICDFSKGEFPNIYAELSICFAMVMYTKFEEELIDNICEHTQKMSIFTAITWEGLPDVKVRRYSAMVSDITEQQIIDRFDLNNFSLKDKHYHTAGNSTMTFFLFDRNSDKK